LEFFVEFCHPTAGSVWFSFEVPLQFIWISLNNYLYAYIFHQTMWMVSLVQETLSYSSSFYPQHVVSVQSTVHYMRNNNNIWAGGVTKAVEYLPSKCKPQSSNLSTIKIIIIISFTE
jgi:hypothetical protein